MMLQQCLHHKTHHLLKSYLEQYKSSKNIIWPQVFFFPTLTPLDRGGLNFISSNKTKDPAAECWLNPEEQLVQNSEWLSSY